MILLSKKSWLWPFVAVVGLAVYLVSCDGKATQPKPVPDDPKDYRVYMWDAEHPCWRFGYHPTTGQVDSFYAWCDGVSMEISPDGKTGYLIVGNLPGTYVVDLDSLQNGDTLTVLDQLPYAVLAFSPNGELMAVYKDDGLYVLWSSDYSVLYRDTANIGFQAFSSNSERLYGGGRGVCVVDLSDTLFPITRKSFIYGSVYAVAPSLDETRWFLYLKAWTGDFYFAVYDVTLDSVIFADYLVPGHGELELSRDGRYVFYSNPGTMAGGKPGPPWFTVYDVEKNAIHKQISTVGLFEPPYEDGIPVGEFCRTPDGRRLAIAGAGFPHLLTLDIAAMEITTYIKAGSGRRFQFLRCQNAP